MRFQGKPFTSLLLTLVSLALMVSGVVLYITPRGRVANWTGWSMLGLGKHEWQAVHMNVALVFLIVAGLHLFWNWSLFLSYLKKTAVWALNLKLELAVALLLVMAILAGTIYRVAPFNKLLDVNYQIKDYWEGWAAAAPQPHAEEQTIRQYSATLGLSTDDVLQTLRQAGLTVADENSSVAKVAEANNKTPADIHAIIKAQFPETLRSAAEKGQGRGLGPGPGKGRGMGPGKGHGRSMGPQPD